MNSDEKVLSNCFLAEILIASVIGSATVLKITSIITPLFYISFFIPMVYLYRIARSFSKELFFLIFLCVMNVTISGMIENGAFGLNYYKKVIMFSTFMFLVSFCTEVRHCRKILLNLLELLPVVTGFVFVVAYYYLGKKTFGRGGLSLGFSNPNTAGMWLLHLILYGILFVLDSTKPKLRFLYIPVIVVMISMLELTRTRSCYIALVFFAIMVLLRVFHIKANKILCLIIIILPLVYAIIYLNIVDTDWFQAKFSFMASEGKPLDSRIGVWRGAFASIKEHFFLGDYSGISNGTGQSQLHNTHVDVLCSYGTIPFVLFLKLLYDRSAFTVENSDSFYKYVAFSAFCAVLIMGTFEAAMVAGSMGLNLLTVGLLVLANAEGLSDEDY